MSSSGCFKLWCFEDKNMNVHPVWYNWDGVYDSNSFYSYTRPDRFRSQLACVSQTVLSYSSTDYQLMSLLFERLVLATNKNMCF